MKIKKFNATNRYRSANWRIVIPNLIQYKNSSFEELQNLKNLILERLYKRPQDPRSHIKSQFDRGLKYYHIALQRHHNDIPHLDILLIYDKSIQRQLVDYDYLLKHGNISVYRKLNQAIIDYGKKQDKQALSNLPKSEFEKLSLSRLIQLQEFKKNPYSYLYDRMKQDPLHFNLEQYVQKYQLSKYISGWSSIKTKLKDMQVAAANFALRDKPGLRFINRSLIETQLSDQELQEYDSWYGYQVIVDCINQLILYPNFDKSTANPLHTKHLLITGFCSGIGKTSLVEHDPIRDKKYSAYPGLQNYFSTYKLKVAEKYFPPYRSHVYNLVYWDQFKIDSNLFSKKNYDLLLSYLGGSQCLLPVKYSTPVRRQDHPFHIMTSNYSLQQHIVSTFNSQQARDQVRSNLKDRLVQVRLPPGKQIHFLRKLFVSLM